MTHDEMMREGAAKIAREYADPPEGGTLVPRAWVEAMFGPASGYREIANADGIHWHERIADGG